MLVTAGAYRLSNTVSTRAVISSDLAQDTYPTPFHESLPCLLMIAINAISMLIVYISQLVVTSQSGFGSPSLWQWTLIVCSESSLLMLAEAAVGLQLCWIRWQRRSETVAWELAGLSRSAFLRNRAALALIVIVGIPTVNAMAFLFWLGPFNYTGW